MSSSFSRFKPGLEKTWLYGIAGLLWVAAGLILVRFAWGWIAPMGQRMVQTVVILGGSLLALAICRFGFSKFADKNIRRIEAISSKKVCLFAFQEWSSYPLVAFMISLGIYLRKYSSLSVDILAVMYMGIGTSLLLASWHYFDAILKRNHLSA